MHLVGDRGERKAPGHAERQLPLRQTPRRELHGTRQIHHEDRVQLAFGVTQLHVDLAETRRGIPVDAPDVLTRLVAPVLPEVEPHSLERAGVGADQPARDLPARVDLHVPEFLH